MRVLAILLALALAGCFSAEEPVESAAAADAADLPAADTAATPTAAADAVAPPVPRDFPVAVEGNTGYWACLPSGPTSCSGSPVSTPSSNTWVEAKYDGVIRSADLTLTWSATTPATSEMYLFVMGVKSCGDNCYETDDTTFRAYASGTSPLVLTVPEITLSPEETLWLHVGTVDPTPPAPTPFFYTLEQAFTLEGKLVALVPP